MTDLKEIFCRPKWYAKPPDGQEIVRLDLTKYKAIQIPKDSEEAEDVFITKYLELLPENFIWKIFANLGAVYRSDKDFKEEFDVIEKTY